MVCSTRWPLVIYLYENRSITAAATLAAALVRTEMSEAPDEIDTESERGALCHRLG